MWAQQINVIQDTSEVLCSIVYYLCMQYPYMLTYALYTAADWAPCRGLGPGPGGCITLLNDTDCEYHQK